MRPFRAFAVVVVASILAACPPDESTDGPVEPPVPPGPIGPVDGGVPEELGRMLLESIAIWEEHYADVPFGSTWRVVLRETYDRPSDDPVSHHRLALDGELTINEEPAFPDDNPDPGDALTFYLTRSMSLVGHQLFGQASGALNFKDDDHFVRTEDWQSITESTYAGCVAQPLGTTYDIVGGLGPDYMDIVYVRNSPDNTRLECRGHVTTVSTDKLSGDVSTSEGPTAPYTTLHEELALMEIPYQDGTYTRGHDDQLTIAQTCADECERPKCTRERILRECDQVTLAMQAVCSSLNDWMVEVVRTDRPTPTIICETADCQAAVDANAARGWNPFTAITYSDVIDCTGSPPAACEVNCYGWQ